MRGITWFSAFRIGKRLLSSCHLLLLTTLFLMVWPSQAKQDRYADEPETFVYDESLEEKWKESDVIVPSYPRDSDLIPVTLAKSFTLKIYLDSKSLSQAADRVVRFSLIVESPSGARNVFYDGMRCETREYKTYAIGSAENRFEPVKDPQWQRIPMLEFNSFRHYLYRHYVCDDYSTARSPAALVRIIKYEPYIKYEN
jgi:hypothetical protein